MPNLRWLCTPLPCALILCVANAFKAPVVDDTAYLWYARQIQQTPLEPFGQPPQGFSLIWYQDGQGAFSLLIPMVVPYWLAIGIQCFGENIVLLKLWLFPFCWLFTSCLFALLRRFAPGYARPLLIMTVVSPTFLPSVNLMIDLPALSLGLAAIVLFFRAIHSPNTNYFLIVLSGFMAGLAAQTKYNAAIATAAICWAGILHRRHFAAIVVAALSVATFASWELYLKSVYGQSHFLAQLESQRQKMGSAEPAADGVDRLPSEFQRVLEKKADFIAPLIGNLGGLLPALALLAGAALRLPARFIRWGAAFVVSGFVLMAMVPNEWAVYSRDAKGQEEVTLGTIFVSITGMAAVIGLQAVTGYLGFRGWSRRRPRLRPDRATWFLIGWAILEIAGYFVLSPFPAARRVMGLVIAVTLLVGRLLSRTCRSRQCRSTAQVPIVLGIVLGILFGVVDYLDALQEVRAPMGAVEWIRQQPGGDRPIWFAGHWGFHYAAERAGAKPIFPGESEMEPGDWLIHPEGYRPYSQRVHPSEENAELRFVGVWTLRIGWRTIPDYYCGYMPIRHHEGGRIVLRVFRVTR